MGTGGDELFETRIIELLFALKCSPAVPLATHLS